MSHIYIVLVRTSTVYKYFENKYDCCKHLTLLKYYLKIQGTNIYIKKTRDITLQSVHRCTRFVFKNDSLFLKCCPSNIIVIGTSLHVILGQQRI